VEFPRADLKDELQLVQGFEGRVIIPPWAVFIAGVVVGAVVVFYVTCSKS